MSDLPAPPVPADLDLSGLEYMPLLVARLKRSKAWLRAKRNPALAFYMVNLWTAAWMEKPATSLEDDDDVLADAAMCEPSKWPKIKSDAMRGFVKHSDGRLYHHVLVDEGLKALEKRIKWLNKKRKQRGIERDDEGDARPEPPPVHPYVPGDRGGDGQGETPLRDGTGRDGTPPEGCGSGVADTQTPLKTLPSVLLPREEKADLQGVSGLRDPRNATPGGPADDRRADASQAAWFNAACAEVKRRLPTAEAEAIIAGAIDGDPQAKASIERLWATRERGVAA